MQDSDHYVLTMIPATESGAKPTKCFTFHSIDAAIAFGNGVKSGATKCLNPVNAQYANARVRETDERTGSPTWCEGMTDAECYAAIVNPTESKRESMDRFGRRISTFEAPMVPQSRRRLVKRLDDGDAIDAVDTRCDVHGDGDNECGGHDGAGDIARRRDVCGRADVRISVALHRPDGRGGDGAPGAAGDGSGGGPVDRRGDGDGSRRLNRRSP